MTLFPRLVTIVRLMLGAEFVLNGLNWWVKLIEPYPTIGDNNLPPGDFVAGMIATGFMFHIVKGTELLAGVALLANRFVPLALVAVFPVTVNVFLVDVFLHHRLRGTIMGSGAMAMSAFLMLACLPHFATMLTARTQLAGPVAPPAWLPSIETPWFRGALNLLGIVAAAFGVVMLTWLGVMIVQHFSH